MKLIELSKKGKKNKGKYFAQVDDEDYELLNSFNWTVAKSNRHNIVYALRKQGEKAIMMHRQIMNISDDKLLIDHKDHNGLNNRRSNLRVATYTENNRNSTARKNAASKYLGVTLEHYKKTYTNKSGVTKKMEYLYWLAIIRVNNKTIRLGSFKDELSAAKAYD
jgi:hypothetical protein